jgi:acyl-CoA thioesterase
MEKIREFFKRDKLAEYLGIELVEVSPGRAVTRMAIQPCHLNGIDTVHGGAIFTLADFAFAVACNSHGTIAVAINVSISFLKAATQGTLTARAREVSRSSRLGSYAIDITDDAGELVATFQGLAYRKNEPLEAVAGKLGAATQK